MKARGLFGLMEVVSLSGKVWTWIQKSRVWVAAGKIEDGVQSACGMATLWFSRIREFGGPWAGRRLAVPLLLQKTR